MFSDDPNAESKANKIAKFLSDHAYFKSHARRVGLQDLQNLGVKVTNLSIELELHNAIREAYCAVDITLGNSSTVRLIENHLGNAVIRRYESHQVALQLPVPRIRPPSTPSPGG